MSTETLYPHLSLDDKGTICIGTSRYKVCHLAAEHYQHGWSAEELLRQHPDLRPEEVYAALTYFYDHYDSMVAEMKADLAETQARHSTAGLSRNELLKRASQLGK